MTQIAQCRLEGDRDKDKALIAEMSKLISNSLYGRMITNKEKHHDIVYVDESEISTGIIDNHFYDVTELPDGYYEVERTKQKSNLDFPINIGVFILNLIWFHSVISKLLVNNVHAAFSKIIEFVKSWFFLPII